MAKKKKKSSGRDAAPSAETAMDDIQSETAPTPVIFTPSTEPALPTEMADAGNLESHALKPGTPPADTAAEYQGFLQPEDDDIPPLDLPFTPNRSSLSVERLGGASTTAAAANDDKTDPPVATSTADDDDKTDPSVATSTADDDDKTDPPVAGSAALGLGSAVLPALPARKPKARKTAPPPLPAATTAAAVPVLSRKQQRLSNRRAMMQSMLDHMQQEQPPPVPPPLPPANTGPSEDVEVGQVPGQAESAALLEAVRRSVGSRYVALVSCVAWTLRGYVWLREYAAALDRLSVQQLRRTTLAATTDATLARDPLLTQLLAHASLGPNQLIADAELCTAVCQLHDKPGHLLDLVLHAYFAIHHARDEAPHPPDRTALLGIMATADAMSVRKTGDAASIVAPAAEEREPTESFWGWQATAVAASTDFAFQANPFYLYWVAYGRLVDPLAPWVLVAGVAAACEGLPAWAASLALPTLAYTVAWLHGVASVRFSIHVGATQVLASAVFAVEAASFLCFKLVMAPVVADWWWLTALLTVLFVVSPTLHVLTITTDPGFVALPAVPLPPPDSGTKKELLRRYCDTCAMTRPLRAKHCPLCDRCVARFDHHCPVICNCVGAGNQRWFLLFLITLWLGQATYIAVTGIYIARSMDAQVGNVLYQCVYALVARPLPLVLGLAQVGGIVYNSFLLGRAALGAATNITVNEEMNVARYEYLQGGHGGTFLNPFDEGAAANCEQFFRDPAQHPDWEAVAAAGSGGKGAGRTGGWQRDVVQLMHKGASAIESRIERVAPAVGDETHGEAKAPGKLPALLL